MKVTYEEGTQRALDKAEANKKQYEEGLLKKLQLDGLTGEDLIDAYFGDEIRTMFNQCLLELYQVAVPISYEVEEDDGVMI